MSVLSVILSGDNDFADIMFLVGSIAAFLAFVVSIPKLIPKGAPYAAALLALAVTALSLGFLAL